MNKLIFSKKVNGGQYLVFNQKPNITFIEVNQTHSNLVVETSQDGTDADADGLLSNYDEILCIKTADCLPVLLLSENQAALLHAGWRGLKSEILLNKAIKQMRPTYAYIGPGISQMNYEVTQEFLKYFPSKYINELSGQYYFSAKDFASHQLKSNYPDINVESCDICTFEHESLHSYRQDKTIKRNWNLFVPEKMNIDYNKSELN